MPPPHAHLRSRPIAAGQLRAFEAVARHLNFRAASEELSLTQSAVSRQIQSLEDDVGVSTWASFASMWLIPRLEAFQREHPDIDIRIDATDTSVDLDTTDVDLALRYSKPGHVPPQAQRLFGEQLTPVVSPWLLQSGPPLQNAQDLARFALIEASDAHRTQHMEWLSWQRWFDMQGLMRFEPKRWLYFNYAHQIAQAALTGQGVALARMPLVAESLSSGDLVEALPGQRMDSPMAYWLIVGPRNAARPEVQAFCSWIEAQAAQTREAIGDVPPTAPT